MSLRKLFIILLIAFFSINISFAGEIHDAAKKGDLKKVKVLLDKNPQLLKASDQKGNTALHLAASGGHVLIVRLLLSRGADINQTNVNGDIPLHGAAYMGKVKAVECLLEKGSQMDKKNLWGWSPLFYAINEGQSETANLLIRKGADLYSQSNSGLTAFESVSQFRFYNKKMVQFLIGSGLNVPKNKRYINDMLHSAAYNGHSAFIRHLVSRGADIKSMNSNNGTFLHSVAAGGLVDYVKGMLKKKYAVNQEDRYGLTPLMLASSGGHLKAVKVLIANNANIHAHSILGKGALHYAREKKHRKVVDFLVTKGAQQGPAKFPLLSGSYLGQKQPGLEPELFAPGIISSPRYEHTSVVFSPKGNEIFWTSEFIGVSGSNVLCMSLKDNRWTPPQNTPFSSKSWEINPAFSTDGKTLYFTSFRSLKGAGGGNIWYTQKSGSRWSKAKPLPSNINSPASEEGACVAQNGNLYFASRRAGGKGERDIYRSRFVNGVYQDPVNLGDSINTSGYESFPYIAPDERYLIFETERQGNFGQVDIYISFRRKDGTWKKAVNLGQKINSSGEDRFATVSADGKFLFYASAKSGNMDIYWVDAAILEKFKK